MDDRLLRRLLAVYRHLPRPLRRGIVTASATPYHLGALCVIERPADGAVLLVRHTYRGRWGLPGGLSRRGEGAAPAAVREAREEVGLHVELVGEPVVIVEPADRRVDVVFRAVPARGADGSAARPCSAEIAECAWFPADDLPLLQPEAAGAIAALDRALGRDRQVS